MFRALGKSKIAFVLAILFGVSLFFFKSGSRYSNFLNSDSVIAQVSNTPISTTKFNRTMQMNIVNFGNMLNKDLTGEEIRAFQIHSLALGALINDALFEDEFNEIGFKIDEKLVAQKTKDRIPQLYDSNNNLDEEYLTTFLQQQKLNIEDIVQIVDFETRNNFFKEAFFNINFPNQFSNEIYSYDNHERKISYISFDINKVEIDKLLNEYSSNLKEELDTFYQENISQYMTEEKRDVEYFLLDKKLFRDNYQSSDFEINEYYESNKHLFFQNETRSFIQYNFKTIEEANKFKDNISNKNFQEILDYSKNNNIFYTEFDDLKANEVLSQIGQPLFKLKVNEVSDIIETTIAKHIVILKSIESPRQLQLDEVKEDIENTIKELEANNYHSSLSDQISEAVLNGNSFEQIINSFNLNKEVINNLSKDYENTEDYKKNYIDSLIQYSFNSNKDFVSDIIKVDDSLSYVFNVTNINVSKPLPFKEIEDVILNDWKRIKKIDKINKEVEKNKNNLNYVSQLADRYNIEINNISLSKDSNKMPKNILRNIYNSEKNNNFQSIFDDKIYIVRVNDVLLNRDIDKKEVISISDDLRSAFGQELMNNKNISTNDNLISAIIEQY